MVVPRVRVEQRYRDPVMGVVFTEADSPTDDQVMVWACPEVVDPSAEVVIVLPPEACAVEVQALLDAGYTIRLAVEQDHKGE